MTVNISLSYDDTKLNRLVLDKLSSDIPRVSSRQKFYMVEEGKYYLVIAKIDHVSRTVFKDRNEVLVECTLKAEKYSFENIHEKYPEAPKVEAEFNANISKFSRLGPVEAPPQFILIGENNISISFEMQQGILGLRGSDHTISLEKLTLCMKKKLKNALLKDQEVHYLYDTDKKRVLLFVLGIYPPQTPGERKKVVIKTAYYPTHSYLHYKLNRPSLESYTRWENSLAKI